MISDETWRRADLVLRNPTLKIVGVADVEGAAVAVEHVGPEGHERMK